MGKFRDSLNKIFGTGPKEKPIEADLQRWGINLIVDKRLRNRLMALQVFFDELNSEIDTSEPETYLKELKDRQEMLNRAIHSLASPYYRAGSIQVFRDIMEGWQLWNSLALYWIDGVQDRIKSIQEEKNGGNNGQDSGLLRVTTIDIETIVRRLHTNLQFHVWQDGLLVLAESYQSLDVTPAHATIVKAIPGQRGGIDLADITKQETV